MSKIVALKKKAAELEKKSPEKAIPVYVDLLAEMEQSPADLDVALFNRVGDLMLKQGSVGDAADYYEKAVDYYAEGGFFNNAIALCNKILRSSPGRASVYYKLGRISAQKGFKADAKQNFLEYADRMQKAAKTDEAFRALAEFADLCPDQTDIRLMLADQLAKAGKKNEAVEQFQLLYEQLESEGRADEAQAAVDRMKTIDPTAEPRTGGGPRTQGKSRDLVFLDLGDTPTRRSIAKRATQGLRIIPVEDEKSKARPAAAAEPVVRKEPPPPVPPPPAQELPLIVAAPEIADEFPPTTPAPEIAEEFPPTTLASEIAEELPSVTATPEMATDRESLFGLESTSLSGAGITSGMDDIEVEATSLLEPSPEVEEASQDHGVVPEAPADELLTVESTDFSLSDDAFVMPDASATLSTESAAADLPLLDTSPEKVTPVSVPQIPEDMRSSTLMAAKSVEMLQAVIEGDPEDWASHRELAEAMLEAGNREDGVRELEVAMAGYERAGDLTTAMSVADEIVRVDPSSVKHHQKRVEYAYRTNDRPQLVEAYLALADALFRAGQVDKSRTIYQRVLELSPDDLRAQAALSTIPEPAAEPPPQERKSATSVKRTVTTAIPARPERKAATPTGDDSLVNLGDWLRDEDAPKDTRMVVAEEEPTGNEDADFADMLKKFKAGIAENVEAEDYQSHYDLGVAYKEMGLIDEAISEFQKALRGPDNRLRTYEAIGNCFIEKGQNQMAATLLQRALGEKGFDDDQLVGVLYLLGRANESLGRGDDAVQYYQRVFVVDIQFRDVGDRLNALEKAAR